MNPSDCQQDKARDFFRQDPAARPIFEHLSARILNLWPDTKITEQKSQISFSGSRPFCRIWLPVRKVKDRPEHYIIVTVGLRRRLDSKRVAEVAEPYPGRFTHHLIISDIDAVDGELLGWIAESCEISGRRPEKKFEINQVPAEYRLFVEQNDKNNVIQEAYSILRADCDDDFLLRELETCIHYLQGGISAGEARKHALACHRYARTLKTGSDIAFARACGHAIAIAHVKEHALAFKGYFLKYRHLMNRQDHI